jgi:hypothetical protein
MKLFTWIKRLLQPQGNTIRVNSLTMPLAKWRRNGGYQPCSHGGTPNPPPSDFDDYLDREIDREIARRRGSNPPAPGNNPAAPAELPSDELMERWKSIASHKWLYGGPPVSHRVALLAIAWARQQQAQSLQLPPPGADPVATKEDLTQLWFEEETFTDFGRTLYEKGRADERTAILRALGVQP